ncbi:hypothetical protein BSKO_09999 [Bryopsis sp. KO-2023]|nr:hypothetical protein BSKO_09999 [Bryopsis sp. KO-2023]
MAISLNDHALGKTGQFIAACRTVEFDKSPETRKFSDPWARNFATEGGMELARRVAEESSMSLQDLANIVTARTCFLDDVVNRAVSKETPKIRQVVIAAVGGDARPYRMHFPDDVVVFEMDFPDVMKFRSKIFTDAHARPTCDLRSIEVDLSKDGWVEALEAAGFKSSEPSVWTTEGLLMYLPDEECKKFVSQIAALCTPDSVLCGDVIGQQVFNCAALAGFNKVWTDFGAALACSAIDDPKAYLTQFGFDATVKIYQDLVVEFDLGYSSAGPLTRPKQEEEKKDGEEVPPPLNSYFVAIKV